MTAVQKSASSTVPGAVRPERNVVTKVVSTMDEKQQVISLLQSLRERKLAAARAKKRKLADEPFIGMWKDREDMKDPHEYARKIRAQFNKELSGERLRRRLNNLD